MTRVAEGDKGVPIRMAKAVLPLHDSGKSGSLLKPVNSRFEKKSIGEGRP